MIVPDVPAVSVALGTGFTAGVVSSLLLLDITRKSMRDAQ
jgi:hypothetical protein